MVALTLWSLTAVLARGAACEGPLAGAVTFDRHIPRVAYDHPELWPTLGERRPTVVLTRDGQDEILAVDARRVARAYNPAGLARTWITASSPAWCGEVGRRIANYAEFGVPRDDVEAAVRAPGGIDALHDLFTVRFFASARAGSGRLALVSPRRPPPSPVNGGSDIPVIEPLFGRQAERRPGAWLTMPDPSLRPPAHHVYFAPADGATVEEFIAATHTRASVFRRYLHRVGAVKRALGAEDVITLPAFSPVSLVRGLGSSPRLLRVRYDRRPDGVIVTIDHAAPATLAEVLIHDAEYAREHLSPAHASTVVTAHGPIEILVPEILRATDVDASLELKRIANAAARMLGRDEALARRVIEMGSDARAFGSVEDETHATAGGIRTSLVTRGFTLVFGKDREARVYVLAWAYAGKI